MAGPEGGACGRCGEASPFCSRVGAAVTRRPPEVVRAPVRLAPPGQGSRRGRLVKATTGPWHGTTGSRNGRHCASVALRRASGRVSGDLESPCEALVRARDGMPVFWHSKSARRAEAATRRGCRAPCPLHAAARRAGAIYPRSAGTQHEADDGYYKTSCCNNAVLPICKICLQIDFSKFPRLHARFNIAALLFPRNWSMAILYC